MERTCSIESCDEPAVSRGWCKKHYSRYKRHGDPEVILVRKMTPGAPCLIEDCTRKVSARGWCATHYARWRKHGDPLFVTPRVRNTCTIDGCDSLVEGHGLCSRHWQSWKRNGDPLAAKPRLPRDGACSVADCEEPIRYLRLCGRHYYRFKQHGDTSVGAEKSYPNQHFVTAEGDGLLVMTGRDLVPKFCLYDLSDDALVKSRQWHWHVGYATASTLASTGQPRRSLWLHREILGLTQAESHIEVDHRNGTPADNRRRNLRRSDRQTNASNRAVENWQGASRFRGVCWISRDRRWSAQFKFRGKVYRAGTFESEEDAAVAVAELRARLGAEPGY